jgi:hypothetical protein
MRLASRGLVGIAGLVLGLVACGSTDFTGLSPEDPWGGERAGLRIRAAGPSAAARGDDLSVDVEFDVHETHLQHGGLQLDRREAALFARLVLRAEGGTAEVVVTADDPTLGTSSPVPADGVWPTWDLVEEAPDSASITFPLARVWDAAPEGSYTAVLELVYPASSRGNWVGTLRSASFSVTLSESEEIPVTFAAPARLRLSGRDVFYGDEDVERIAVKLRNGFTTGLRIRQSDGGAMVFGGPTVPEIPRQLGRLSTDLSAGTEFRYWMELFETSDSPDSDWQPAAGSGSYRTLWKREYIVRAP